MARLQSGTRIYGNAIIDTSLSINGNTSATSTSTGALVIGGGIGVSGNIYTSGIINASGNIVSLNANLGNLAIANYVQGTLTTSSQPNITSIGNLSSLVVKGDTTLTGNLVVSGNTTYINSTNTTYNDNIIELHTPSNLAPLTVDDGKDIGIRVHYFKSSDKHAFFGVSNDTLAFEYYSDGNESNGIFSGTYGNFKGATFISTVTTGTSPFTVNSTTEVANLTAQFANIANTSNTSNTANTVILASQPNITSVGTLSSLTVNGITTLGNIGNVKIYGGAANYILKTDGTGNLNWESTTTFGTGNANVGGSNTQIFFNDNNSNTLGTSANLTFDKTSNTLTVDKIVSNGSQLSSITGANVTGQVANALVAGTVYSNSQPNITSVGTLANLTVTGNVNANIVTANYFSGDGSNLTNVTVNSSQILSGAAVFVTSNISNIVAGSTVSVIADYSNVNYPGGVFTIAQLGPVSLTMTDVWKESGSATKNAYANYLANTVNVNNVNVTFSLANATFSVQSSDYILIGSANITGANLTGLNISGTGGTYTIPSSYIGNTVETTTTSTVSAHLTTNRGLFTASGTTLTATQPVAFTVNSVSGSFPSSSVPYFNLNQSFNWSVSVTGTASAGNLTFSGNSVSTTSLTSTGTTSGSSTSVDSTSSYTLTTNDYYGSGLYGYGNRTIPSTVTGTVSAATKYYPLFYKINSSSSNPNFTTSDTYLTHNYTTGDAATTSSNTSQYLWIAIPGSSSHTFAYTFLGSQVGQLPAQTYTGQTIAGYTYNVYGFTNFSVATSIYTVT